MIGLDSMTARLSCQCEWVYNCSDLMCPSYSQPVIPASLGIQNAIALERAWLEEFVVSQSDPVGRGLRTNRTT